MKGLMGIIVSIIFLILLISCATTVKEPWKETNIPKLVPGEDYFKIEVQVKDLKIYVVSNKALIPEKCREIKKDACLQTEPLSIWIVGKKYKGEVVMDELYLGHELWHIIDIFTHGLESISVMNPDVFHEE